MTLTIWQFTDGKAGHENQSAALIDAISSIQECECFTQESDAILPALKNYFSSYNHLDAPAPDLIIGAGHATHIPMLLARHRFGGKVIVLMKPSLPYSFFDICLVPEHDQTPVRNNIIKTKGAINSVMFNANKTKDTGLILIGGESKHYIWNSDSILSQIVTIVSHYPDINWYIANSRRTPTGFLNLVKTKNLDNVILLDLSKTDKQQLQHIMHKADIVWVSKDSISMIYEALSSGAKTGLLDLKPYKQSRIIKGIEYIISNETVTDYADWLINKIMRQKTIINNEALRCASELNERGFLS